MRLDAPNERAWIDVPDPIRGTHFVAYHRALTAVDDDRSKWEAEYRAALAVLNGGEFEADGVRYSILAMDDPLEAPLWVITWVGTQVRMQIALAATVPKNSSGGPSELEAETETPPPN